MDIAPTLLQLAGVPIPPTMAGHSLLEGCELAEPDDLSADEEELLRERLSALGYIG
jgi:arylsulfatase A-like enzyme